MPIMASTSANIRLRDGDPQHADRAREHPPFRRLVDAQLLVRLRSQPEKLILNAQVEAALITFSGACIVGGLRQQELVRGHACLDEEAVLQKLHCKFALFFATLAQSWSASITNRWPSMRSP